MTIPWFNIFTAASVTPSVTPTKTQLLRQTSTTNSYTCHEKIFTEDKKHPPSVPPHLYYTPLNRCLLFFFLHIVFSILIHSKIVYLSSTKINPHDPSLLPVPLHVTLNHSYFFTSSRGVSQMGTTQRYKKKFTTVVIYKPTQEQDDDHENEFGDDMQEDEQFTLNV